MDLYKDRVSHDQLMKECSETTLELKNMRHIKVMAETKKFQNLVGNFLHA
jgi:hypothetical protein